MRRVPKLSVAHFAYIVVTIYDLSSAHTSHIFNSIKFALRFLRYLGIEHGKSYLNSEAGTMAALLPTYSHMESFFCVLSLFLAQRLPHPLLFYIAGSPEV